MVDQKLDKDQLHYPPQPQQQVLQDCEVVVALGRVNDLFTKEPVDMCVFCLLLFNFNYVGMSAWQTVHWRLDSSQLCLLQGLENNVV